MKLLIAGYPKSGNTWLGYMLSYALGARYVDLHQVDQPNDRRKVVMDLIGGNLAHSSSFELVAKTHDLPARLATLLEYDKVILIVRDPRDVAVSYFFFRYRLLPVWLESPLLLQLFRLRVSQFLFWKHTILKVAREWPFHYLCWKSSVAPLVIRYEDLHRDTRGQLLKSLGYMGTPAEEILVDKAIQSFAFEEMSGGRKAGEEDAYHFYRKGIIGDHRNHLSRFDDWVIRHIAGEQMEALQYGIESSAQ